MNAANTRGGQYRLLVSGIDSLYVSFFLNVAQSDLDFGELFFQKERLRQSTVDQFAELKLGSETFALKPYGKRLYPIILANKAFEVQLAERMSPSCHVRFTSEGLWLIGIDGLIDRFRAWCASLNLVDMRPEMVARADMAFDYHLPAVDFAEDHFVSRAAKDAKWRENGKAQTFQFGKGSIVVRIYDKVAEIEQASEKGWLYQLWGRRDNVWRIEFQVRKDRLRQAGIVTIEDLKVLQNDLLRELATNHTTLRIPTEDSNRSRWPLHPLWSALQDEIARRPQTGLIREIDPRESISYRRHLLTKSLYGSLKGLGALLTLEIDDGEPVRFETVVMLLPVLLKPHHNGTIWEQDIERRINAYELGQR